jgi:hypothetical protein
MKSFLTQLQVTYKNMNDGNVVFETSKNQYN